MKISKSDIYNSQNDTKEWHHFVRQLCFQLTSHSKKAHNQFDPTIFHLQMTSTETFLVYSKKEINVTEVTCECPDLHLLKYYSERWLQYGVEYAKKVLEKHFRNVTKVSGYFVSGHMPHKKLSDCRYHIIWVFQQNKKLSVNFTFHNISFMTDPSDCSSASLRIRNSYIVSDTCCSFCGKVSEFNLYPMYLSTSVELDFLSYIIHLIHVSFVMMDQGITSTQEASSSLSGVLKSFMITNMRKHQIHHYHIQVEKVNQMWVCVPSSVAKHLNITMFDGPGDLSDVLTPVDGCFKTSTFQFNMYLVSHWFGGRNILSHLYFSSKIKNFVPISVKTQTFFTLNIPNWSCEIKKYCALLIQSSSGQQINMSVTKLNYSGVESQTCSFGGIAVLEQAGDKFEESATLCEPHDERLAQSRLFYSVHSSLMVVVFWYREYSTVNATVNISPTECKTVQICECTFESHCYLAGNSEPCLEYLRKITEHSHVRFKAHTGYSIQLYLLYSLNDEKCFTLQFRRNETLSASYEGMLCRIDVASQFTQTANSLSYQIVGFLHPPLVDLEKLRNKNCFLKIAEDIESRGLRKAKFNSGRQCNFHYYQHQSPASCYDFREIVAFGGKLSKQFRITRMEEPQNMKGDFFTLFQHLDSERRIFLSADISVFNDRTCFYASLTRLITTKSWLDITVFKSKQQFTDNLEKSNSSWYLNVSLPEASHVNEVTLT